MIKLRHTDSRKRKELASASLKRASSKGDRLILKFLLGLSDLNQRKNRLIGLIMMLKKMLESFRPFVGLVEFNRFSLHLGLAR